MPAPIVIAIMIAILCISKSSNSSAVLLTTLAVVATGTLFFALAGAAAGDNGGLLAVGGFVGAFVVGFIYNRAKITGRQNQPTNRIERKSHRYD